MAKQVSVTKKAYDNMLDMLAPYSKQELCQLMGTVFKEFVKESGEAPVSCPALLLVGEFDQAGKIKDYNQKWSVKQVFP